MLVGDVGLNRSNQPVEAKGARRGGFLSWEDMTAGIAEDINGDLNFMNVETVVTDRNDLARDTKGQSGPFNFRIHPNGLRHLVSRGFNLLSLANNHSMDYGVPGLKETLQHVGALEKERLAVATGIGMNRDEAAARGASTSRHRHRLRRNRHRDQQPRPAPRGAQQAGPDRLPLRR